MAAAPTYVGRTFAGWNTLSNGTGTNYAAGASYTLVSNVTLFAQWMKNIVTYNSQGGSKVNSASGIQGTSITLAAAPTYVGRTFAGWNTLSNGTGTNYAAGARLILASDVTLYAKWTNNASITVTYNSQGGSIVSSASGLKGTSITLAAAPTYAGRTFTGWNTLKNGTGTNYAAGDSFALVGNVTLYAQWTTRPIV